MISVIIPQCEEPRIHEVTEKVEKILRSRFSTVEILIASDRYRKGKGWAVREAMKIARGAIIVFLDGDMDIDPRMILRLLPHLNEFDIVVGKKDTRGLWSRYILTLLSRIYIRMMFGIKVDTQTGIKAFWRSVMPEWETDGYGFDLEILAKAQKAKRLMYEVTVDAKVNKKMRLRSIINTFFESIKIARGLR